MSDDAVYRRRVGDLELVILWDDSPSSPREWDNLGTMACWHRRYRLGDVQPSESPREFKRQLVEDLIPTLPDLLEGKSDEECEKFIDKKLDELYVTLPLYLYDHSGLAMSVGGFSCSWDSGQVGFIYVSKKKARAEMKVFRVKRVAECLADEVETYDQYLRGDTYGFKIMRYTKCSSCGNEEVEELYSCWGFYGRDWATNGLLDHLGDKRYLYKEA